MGELAGKVYIVTGANTGIGKVTALELARRGARVILASRSADKTQAVIDEIRKATGNADVELLSLDLADLASVRAAAKAFLDRGLPLHGLINNAGLAGLRGRTADGFEMTFGTNHLGHFLFTALLLDKLKASAPARIVNVSSVAHRRAQGIDWDAVRKPARRIDGVHEYAVSKLANVLFTKELARRLAGSGVTAYALHPGAVATDVWRHVPWPFRPLIKMFLKSPEEGARTTLYCATAPELAGESGRYYQDSKETPASPVAEDAALAADLWRRSAEWTGIAVN
jgi:NAD(P)-dependent dehydrogenase (short-subunit alcohol dehydrogenase family)